MYKQDFIINFAGVDRNYNVRLQTLLQMTTDLATIHADDMGFGPMYLSDKNLAWIIYESKIDMKKTDLYAHKISIETFVVPKKNIYFTRYFLIYDENGTLIGTAMSKWVIMDIEKRSLSKIPQEMVDGFNEKLNIIKPEKKELIEQKFENIKYDVEDFKETRFDIRYFDIDPNKHVNNTVYVMWSVESIAQDMLDTHRVKSASIIYKKECYCDKKEVIVKYKIYENTSYHEIYDDNNLLAIIKLWFEKIV